MENEWPPLEKCPQFQCDMLQPFLQKFAWEDDESDDETYYEDSSEDEDGNVRRFAYKPSTLRKFLQQVRTTRGYDVDDPVPAFMCNPFKPYSEKSIRVYGEWVNHAIELAINHINSKTRKFYKHVDTLKVVDTRHRVLLLTFTAGEVAPPPNVNKQMKKKENEKKKENKKKKEKKENKKKKVADVTTDVADVANKQTFLAAVYAPVAVRGTFELEECFLKPEGPAPWKYFDVETRSFL